MLTIDLNEICSLSGFQRNAKAYIKRMKKTGRPVVLTVNGKAQMVALDVESFQNVLEALDRIQAIEGIERGLESMRRGASKSADQYFEEIRTKHKIRQGG